MSPSASRSRRCLRLTLAALAAAGVVGAGCVTDSDPHDALDQTIHVFNGDLRWSKYDAAALHMPPTMRSAYLEHEDGVDKNLEIDDLQILRIAEQAKGGEAESRVVISWDRKNEGVLHTTTLREHWLHEQGVWIVTRIETVAGDELPFLHDAGPITASEPASEPASGPASEATPSSGPSSPIRP